MKVVLLPGMDGTGILSDPFIAQSPSGIDVVSVPLIQSADYDYDDHARHVVSHIGSAPIVLVAESYSGMIAYHMLRMGCENIKHVVFAASFISRPSLMPLLAGYLPITLIKSRLMPRKLLGQILFGRFSSSNLLDCFYQALGQVDDNLLRQRLVQIAGLNDPDARITVPCTYIRPTNDNLVAKSALNSFRQVCDGLAIREVAGTHFVLQTNPRACWKIIQDVCV